MIRLGVFRPSQNAESVHSVPLSWLMEETQRREMAGRLRELRERSRFTQPEIADQLGIGLRAYQKLESRGTTRWERCEELGGIFDVPPDFIWSGENYRAQTPAVSAQLEELLEKVDQLLDEFAAGRAVDAASQASSRSRSGSAQKRSSRRK